MAFTRQQARKFYECARCGQTIFKGDYYYRDTISVAGQRRLYLECEACGEWRPESEREAGAARRGRAAANAAWENAARDEAAEYVPQRTVEVAMLLDQIGRAHV